MAHLRAISIACLVLCLVHGCVGQGSTNSRSDRISQALSASSAAIQAAASGSRGSAREASLKSRDFARLATKDGVRPEDIGRKLMQGSTNSRSDRITQALSASSAVIQAAATGGRSSTREATTKSRDYAILATHEGVKPDSFGRRLTQGSTNSRSDRITQALSASSAAIQAAASGSRGSAREASLKSRDFARLATRDGVRPEDIGRKLMQGSTNSRSDRISQALSASSAAIQAAAIGSRGSAREASLKSRDFARLATRDGVRPEDIGRH